MPLSRVYRTDFDRSQLHGRTCSNAHEQLRQDLGQILSEEVTRGSDQPRPQYRGNRGPEIIACRVTHIGLLS
jgi:hypothetical protein